MILLRQESFSRQEQESHDVVPVNPFLLVLMPSDKKAKKVDV